MKLGDALLDLYRRDGKLTAEQVVAAAVDPASPLHGWFEWDDTAAAHRYRLEQARLLIRGVKVTARGESGPIRCRAFLHEPERDTYTPIGEVVSDLDRRAEHIDRLRRDLAVFRRRLVRFEEFSQIVDAIDEAIA